MSSHKHRSQGSEIGVQTPVLEMQITSEGKHTTLAPISSKTGVQTPSNAAYTALTPLLYLGMPKYKA